MQLKFLNGTTLQQQAVRDVVQMLLNYPPIAMPITLWEVSFVEDPEKDLHNEFAVTSVPSPGIVQTKFRSDVPDFSKSGRDWQGILFFNETAAHELGHGAFGCLPENRSLAVARMFGLDTDDHEALHPPELAWEDRIGEGIAETFKDAFLPPMFRRYYNRTNHKIPIAAYPRFRSYFRLPGLDGFNYVYGSDSFRVDLSEWDLTALPYHRSDYDAEAFVFYQEIVNYEFGWGVDMAQFKESSHHPFSIRPFEEIET